MFQIRDFQVKPAVDIPPRYFQRGGIAFPSLHGLVGRRCTGRCREGQGPPEPEGVVGDKQGTEDTEIHVDDENAYVRWKLQRRYFRSVRAQHRRHDGDPDRVKHADDDESRNSPARARKTRNAPELKVPAVYQGPEDHTGADRGERERRAEAHGQAPIPADKGEYEGEDRLAHRSPRMTPFSERPSLGREHGAEYEEPCDEPY